MKTKRTREDAWLLRTAREVSETLKQECRGTTLRIRRPRKALSMATKGWRVIIGDLGKKQPSLQIWLDLYSGYEDRRFYACFFSSEKKQIQKLAASMRPLWGDIRTLKDEDTQDLMAERMLRKLPRKDFDLPLLESYTDGCDSHYLGIYQQTLGTQKKTELSFITNAVAFFTDVVMASPHSALTDQKMEPYPRDENRIQVASHLKRERSRFLALQCKLRDNHQCQVCFMSFTQTYGVLGEDFAEAHHVVPLHTLSSKVKTRLEDLVTVCANCHRMLHRMEGLETDIRELRSIVAKHRKKRER